MAETLQGLRPVITQPEHDFGMLMGMVLSPSHPLQSEEFLRGRTEQVADIRRALYQPGRHVLIHGLRGVGKSSLAQTAAFLQASRADPILVGCDLKSTFGTVMREIFDEAENKNPALEKRVREFSGGFSRFGLSAAGKVAVTEGAIDEAGSVNDAVRLIRFLAENYTDDPVIVIDEFDQIKDPAEQALFAAFIKQISDRHIPARFIFCGVAESTDKIMAAHASADRYFHTVELGQLPWEARFEIVEDAASRLGITTDRDTVIRIARISDGFPHYVHFISEKLFWRVYEANNDGVMSAELFGLAMSDAASAMDMKLRGPYETATRKYRDDYETVLWAVADGHELVRRSSDVFTSYERIMDEQEKEPLKRDAFNRRMNSLKTRSHAEMLTGSRQGWYEFSEKMIRGYVRLRAEQSSIVLSGDHPKLK